MLRADGVVTGATTELVLCDDSLFGPVFPLNEMFSVMAERPCAYWSLTDQRGEGFEWHAQSGFVVFRKPVLQAEAFWNFWLRIEALGSASPAAAHDAALFTALAEVGLRGESYYAINVVTWHAFDVLKSLSMPLLLSGEAQAGMRLSSWDLLSGNYDRSVSHWHMQLACRIPLIKLKVVQADSTGRTGHSILKAIKACSHYDTALIEPYLRRTAGKPHARLPARIHLNEVLGDS
jgi:rhamnosyltransferase